MKQTNVEGVDGVLSGWGLPKQVVDFLRNIKYSESVDYQTYRFVLRRGKARIEEFVAAGRNYGGNVYLSHMKVVAHTKPKTQYVTTKKCVTRFFIKRCHNVHTARGFKTGELEKMQKALLFHAYTKLSN
jgi:hypothetical protein